MLLQFSIWTGVLYAVTV